MTESYKIRASFCIKTGLLSRDWIFGEMVLAPRSYYGTNRSPHQRDFWNPAIEGELLLIDSTIVFKIDYPINFVKKLLNIKNQELKSYGEVKLTLDLTKAKKIKKRYGEKKDRRLEIILKPHGDFLTKKSKSLEFNIISQDKNILNRLYTRLWEAKNQQRGEQEVGLLEIIQK